MIIRTTLAVACAVSGLAFVGCGKTVTRTDTKEVIDLSGKWNDTDSRLVAEEMIADSLTFPWASEFAAENGRKPTIRLDRVVVRSDGEVIATDIFMNDISRTYIKSGKAKIVSTHADASVTREELKQQDLHATEATRKEAFQETGADYMLHGTINVQNDQEGRKQVKFYSVDLFLTDVQSREQVWQGNKKLRNSLKVAIINS